VLFIGLYTLASCAWAASALASSKAAKAAAAAARACGSVAQSAAICAAAYAIEAAIGAANAESQAMSAESPEFVARTEAVKVCVSAQLQASRCGVKVREPRCVAAQGAVARRNIAVQAFDLARSFVNVTEDDAVRMQHARSKKRSSGVAAADSGADVSGDADAAAGLSGKHSAPQGVRGLDEKVFHFPGMSSDEDRGEMRAPELEALAMRCNELEGHVPVLASKLGTYSQLLDASLCKVQLFEAKLDGLENDVWCCHVLPIRSPVFLSALG
jgi:hypothetical protein